ncbi:MAG TPA: 50S ribosomal protein L15 [Candidatus Saccharimonadales bacterium]|nr:50S ribosomal protein L15 [Candidatus Saccharimonadales bacterium]
MNLPKVVSRRAKRIGRGGGSGKGFHTAGRGQKGQKARTDIHILFEGFKVKKSLIHRLPMHRGKGKFKANAKPITINLEALNLLPADSKVTVDSLVKAGIVVASEAKIYGVKILGDGKLTKKLTVSLPISKSASKKVVAAGGTVN